MPKSEDKRDHRRTKSRTPRITVDLLNSKYILAIGSTLTTILVGLEHMHALPLWTSIHSISDGIMLITLGVVILASVSRECSKHQLKQNSKRFTLSDIIALTIIIPAIVLGVTEIAGLRYPSETSGVVGILYIILAVVMLFSVVMEE